jgi:hypothetical protein
VLIAYSFVFSISTNRKLTFKKPGNLTISVILFFLAQLLSGFFSYDFDLSIQKIYIEFQFLIILLVVNSLIIDNSNYESILKGIIVGFMVSCAIAALQYKGIKSFYLFTPEELNENAGFINEERNSFHILRIWGPFGNSLTFSEYLAITGIIIFSYFRMIRKKVLMAYCFIILSFACISLTAGRNAIFATAFSLLLMELLYSKATGAKKIFITIFISSIACIIVAIFLLSPGMQDNGNPLIGRFTNASQDLKEGRLNLWVKGFQAFTKNIFTGVGPGNLHLALSAEGFPLTSEIIARFNGQHVENYFLTILYTYGIIGFYFCIRLYFYLIKYSYKLLEILKGKTTSLAYGGVMLGGIVALIISDITNPALIFDERIKMLFIFLFVVVNNSFLTFNKVNFFKENNFLRNLTTTR